MEIAEVKLPSFWLPLRACHTGTWWKGLAAIESTEKTISRPFWGNARKLAHQIEINGKN